MTVALAFPLAAAATAAATITVRRISYALGLVALPDPLVPQHTRPVATLGGLAVAAGIVGAAGALRLEPAPALAAAAPLFLVVGGLDDLRPLRFGPKLALQIAAGSPAVALGAALPVSHYPILNGAAALLWILVGVNAVNVTDVCDGLVPGLACIAFAALAVLEPGSRAICLAAAGSSFGFLLFNAPPASIFLGDSGSHLIGFLLAFLSLPGGARATWNAGVAAALVLGVFLFECAFVVTVRARKGVPWWQGSADHLALRLQAAGLSRWETDAVVWGAALALAAAALARTLTFLALVGVSAAVAWRLLLRCGGA